MPVVSWSGLRGGRAAKQAGHQERHQDDGTDPQRGVHRDRAGLGDGADRGRDADLGQGADRGRAPGARRGDVIARFVGVDVYRGLTRVISGLDLSIRRGRVLAILGPSGAGKSTVLTALAGELTPTRGVLDTGGRRLELGMVPQSTLLFPWLTVAENVTLGHTFAAHRDLRASLVEECIALLGLESVRDSYPDEISGGQAQRASLARAMAVDPDLILLDEPFSALDPHRRAELQGWVRDVVHRAGTTCVVVTHDIDEALILADDIVLLAAGGRLTHAWTNTPADPDTVLTSPLRAQIRAAYAPQERRG